MVRGTEARVRASVAEFLVHGAPDLLECLPVRGEAPYELTLLATRHAPNRLAALEAAEERAMVHALVTFAGAEHTVEDLGVGARGGVCLTHALPAADLFLGQHMLARDTGTRIGVRKTVALASAVRVLR